MTPLVGALLAALIAVATSAPVPPTPAPVPAGPLPMAGSAAAVAATPAVPAPVVTAIEIRSEVDLGDGLAEVEGLLSFAVGEPLAATAVARTLRNVQASGIAYDAEMYSRPDEAGEGREGVVAVLVLRPVVRVQQVKLEGSLGRRASELRRELPQNAAEPLSEEKVVQGVYRLQDDYRDRGYLHADVRVRVATDPATRRATVVYHVESGPRARIADVELKGTITPFKPPDLIPHLGLKPGDPYARRPARDDAEKLQTWLVQQGYRTARVDPPVEEVDAAQNAVRLSYPIDVGPLVTVQVAGVPERELRKQSLLPFLGDQGFDEALVLQATERIKDYYQRKGYYKIKVDSREQKSPGALKLVLTVQPGPVYTLSDIEFTGNQAVTSAHLAELMSTAKRRLLNLGSGRLVDSELRTDLDNIRSFYALDGYSQAAVGPPQVSEKGSELRLVIPLREGPRQQLVSLKLEGMEAIAPQSLRNLPLKEGGPFHPYLLDQTLEAVRQAYREKGYGEAQVSARTGWNAGQTLADVTIQVFEGEQMVLDRVIVRGNQSTRSEVIQRTIGAKPGQPISDTRPVEIERDLYRLGIFSSVDVELSRAGLEPATRDLIIRLQEGKPRRVSYSVGLEYDSASTTKKLQPRGGFSFTHNNVAGSADSLRLDLRASPLDQSFRLVFDQPYVGPFAVPLTSSLFFFNETKDHWNVVRYGLRLEAYKKIRDRRFSLAWDYRYVHTTIDPGFGLTDVDREDRPYQIASLIPSFLWDRRDDPVLPTRGWSSLAQLQYAFPVFAAKGDFLKVFLQQTQYLNLGSAGVIAGSVRAGGIQPFRHLSGRDPEVPPGLPNADVFIDERFFAGGGSTHRAYGRDLLGIRGQTLFERPTQPGDFAPVGGDGLLLVNLEYRHRVAGPVEGTLFYDTGNVWADWRSIGLDDLRPGIGVGVRYLSPIGPIRLDIGWKLHRLHGEDPYAVFLSFGNPF